MGVGVSRIYDREKLLAELAGKAMQGILSSDDWKGVVLEYQGTVEEVVARSSMKYADALLAELDRTAEDPIKAGGTE